MKVKLSGPLVAGDLATEIGAEIYNKFVALPINKGTPPPETWSFEMLRAAIQNVIDKHQENDNDTA